MSSQYTDRPKHLMPVPSHSDNRIEQSLDDNDNIVTVFYRLEKFILAARQMETELSESRALTAKFRCELEEAHVLYDRLLGEAAANNKKLTIELNKLRVTSTERGSFEKQLKAQVQFLSSQLGSARAELFQYKRAWASVLQREREAKAILDELQQHREKIDVLNAQIRQLQDELNKAGAEKEQIVRDGAAKMAHEIESKTAAIEERIKMKSKRLMQAERDSELLLAKAKDMNLF